MDKFAALAFEASSRNREHLPRLLKLAARVEAGATLTADEINFLIDANEAAQAAIALGTPSAIADCIIDLSGTISMRSLLNDQRGDSTRYRNLSTNQQQEVTP